MIVAIIVLILLLLYFVVNYYKSKKIHKLVSWSITGGYSPATNNNSYISEILFELQRAQNNIDLKYKVDWDANLKFIREIVEEYQKYIAREYFLDHLPLIYGKYQVSEKDYFFFSFFVFLSKNDGYNDFLGYKLFGDRLSRKDFKDGSFTAIDALSDYGELFYKLKYITFMFCKKHPVLQKYVSSWVEGSLIEILDKKHYEIIVN